MLTTSSRSSRPSRRRALISWSSGLVSAALAVSLVAVGGTAQAATSPAGHGSDWLARQLTDGLIHNNQFDSDDYGLTADTVLALKALGHHPRQVRQARTALAAHATDYTGAGTERYAGALAKLLVVAERTGANPRAFGGVNLVARLNARVTRSGPAKGRIADRSQYGDYANTIGQILAVRGLTAAKSARAGAARKFLLEQQCRQGYFRLSFSKPSARHQNCRKSSPADPDVTSYAVVQLWRQSKHRPQLRSALRHAVAWLAARQRHDGSFRGGTSTPTPNTNSTGLAGTALGLAGRCGAARDAARWVAALQVSGPLKGTRLAGQRGAIAYDRAGLRAGRRDGITVAAQDQWRRATSQAAPVLLWRHGC